MHQEKRSQKTDSLSSAKETTEVIALMARYIYQPRNPVDKQRRKRKRDHAVATLREAARILRKIQPHVLSPVMAGVTVKAIDGYADFLQRLSVTGRPPEWQIGQCAYFISRVFTRHTGQPHYKETGEIVEKVFRDVLGKDAEKFGYDADWAQKACKRIAKLKSNPSSFNEMALKHQRDWLLAAIFDKPAELAPFRAAKVQKLLFEKLSSDLRKSQNQQTTIVPPRL
jgi:hypothetical protein